MDPQQIPLRDLHLPEAISWWPLAPGWWLLIAFAVAACLLLRALFANAVRTGPRAAMRCGSSIELTAVRAHHDAVTFSSRAVGTAAAHDAGLCATRRGRRPDRRRLAGVAGSRSR